MKFFRIAFCFCLLLTGVVVLLLPGVALAQEDGVSITTKFPKVEITSGEMAEFELELKYLGEIEGNPRVFDLVATAPKDWMVTITPVFPKEKKIASIELKPGFSVGEKINVATVPLFRPDPGEYKIQVEVTSGEISGSAEFTVVITARYDLTLASATGRLNTDATAGKDNYFAVDAVNTGTAAIDNITFSSNKPNDWIIEYSIDQIDLLDTGGSQSLDVNIKPPPKAIAGDYNITLKASGTQATASDVDIRVTVERTTLMGFLAGGIIVLVVAGLAWVIVRFSRR